MKAFLFTLLMSPFGLALQAPVRTEAVRPKVDMIEVVCRVKAKEVASHAFRSCLIDDKAAQVQELKRKATRQVEQRRRMDPKSKASSPQKTVNRSLPAKKSPPVQMAPEASPLPVAESPKEDVASPGPDQNQTNWISSDEAEARRSRGQVEVPTEKVQVFKDESTTVDIQTQKPEEPTEKELDSALEQIQTSAQPKTLPKRAILIEDDSEVPEPEEF